MDYEKKYKEALELMKDCIPDADGLVHVRPQDIFPELKEIEGERTKKEIIAILKYKYELYPNDPKYRNIPQWIDWLEKQGEQKIQRCGVSGFTDIVQAIRTVYNEESASDLVEYLTDLVSKKEKKDYLE